MHAEKVSAELALQQVSELSDDAVVDLSAFPGRNGWPIVGDGLIFLRDTLGYMQRMHEQYGPVFRSKMGPFQTLNLIGPEAQKLVLLDTNNNFSTEKGYATSLGEFFPKNLLLRDFSDHRKHRRIMQTAFKNQMLESYMPLLHSIIGRHVRQWADQGEVNFFKAIKSALLEVGSEIFLGLELGKEAQRVNQAFIDLALGSSTPLRYNLPGTPYARAIKAHRYLYDFLRAQIAGKRAGQDTDMFSLFCREKQEDGQYFSDDDIVYHISFLLFAAHDTTTSTLLNLLYEMTRNPAWQDRCRTELQELDVEHLSYSQLGELEINSYCFKETLRLYPPVIGMARRSIREFQFGDFLIPANTMISTSTLLTHRLPELYTNAEEFDPQRFAPDREEHKSHPFAWFPFGGGAHKCIGLHFAEMLTKVGLFEMLRYYKFDALNHDSNYAYIPFPKPRDGLPVKVTAL
ncbi:MAG: cytochrome P450 [Pseudomonadales bacterium]